MIKVANMAHAVDRILRRASETTGGIHVWVGWDGEKIAAGDNVRKSMPHVRIDVERGSVPCEVESLIVKAVLELRQALPPVLAKWKPPPPPKPSKSHAWAKKGASSGKSRTP